MSTPPSRQQNPHSSITIAGVARPSQSNQAALLGGGLALSASPGALLTLQTNTFTGNNATAGGGLHADNSTKVRPVLFLSSNV